MWQKFTFRDLRVIVKFLGVLVTFSAGAMCIPLVVALAMREWSSAAHYIVGIGVALCMGSLMRLAHVKKAKLTTQQALAVTGFAWLLLAVTGSVPLALSGHFGSYLDAFFESMSSWTTTGASLAQDVDHMSFADNTWRFTMQCIGGQGVVVIALSLGLFGRAVDSSLYESEGRSEHVIPNIMQTTRFIVKLSAVVGVAGLIVFTILCLAIGMEPVRAFFNGLWLSVASFNTGGMTSMSPGINYYHSLAIELVVILLAMYGSINFTLHGEIWKGHIVPFFQDIEVKTSVVWLTVATAAFVAALCAAGAYADYPTLVRRGIFTILAAFTSSGFQTISPNQLTTVVSSGALIIIVFVMVIGGSAGSTSGGIKILRVGVLGKEVIAYIKDLLAPPSARQVVTYYHVGRRPLAYSLVRSNLAVFVLYVGAFLITTIATVAYGYDAMPSIFESVSMVSNIGMTAGIIEPDMPVVLKFVYMFDMWAGRLEWVTLIALVVSAIMSFKPRKKVKGRVY